MDAARLSALIASHICHDLVAPISSITMSLDMLADQEMEATHEHAKQVLEDGARKSEAKAKFLRFAFGSPSQSVSSADLGDAKTTLDDFLASTKAEPSLYMEGQSIRQRDIAIFMHWLHIANDIIARGGTLKAQLIEQGNAIQIQIEVEGERARFREWVIEAIKGIEPEGGWTGRNIQPYYLGLLLKASAAKFGHSVTENGAKIQVSLPL